MSMSKNSNKGLFISFEGADGSGKTTQISLLEKKLKDDDYPVIVTCEPGGTAVSKRIRSLLLDKTSAIDYRAEALLYAADRADHVEKVVKPALKNGQIVITDRYIDSSLVYQGIARGLGIDEVMSINAFAMSGLMPDVTFVLDAESAKSRLEERGSELDRIESEGLEFQAKIKEAYLKIAQMYPSRIKVIDANRDPESVSHEILSQVLACLSVQARI